VKTLKRSFVIDKLREFLVNFTDDDHSMCEEAARRGILCKGFRKFTTPELKQKFDYMVKHRPAITRPQLEELINQYELARQEVHHVPLACDAATIDQDLCMGWNEFSNEDLARFYQNWYGEEITVLPSEGTLPTLPGNGPHP